MEARYCSFGSCWCFDFGGWVWCGNLVGVVGVFLDFCDFCYFLIGLRWGMCGLNGWVGKG